VVLVAGSAPLGCPDGGTLVASSKGAGIDAVLEVVRTAAASPHS